MMNLFSHLDRDGDGLLSRDDLQGTALEERWGWRQAPALAVLDRLCLEGPLEEPAFDRVLGSLQRDGPYGSVLLAAPPPPVEHDTALLIIDPQRSFTEGAWAHAVGLPGVEPIRRAFERCATRVGEASGVDLAFTRCPFPVDSYGWDRGMDKVLPPEQPYFVKPGNSALWPPTNGVAAWLAARQDQGATRLHIGGCTLNSCVRVTATEIRQQFPTLRIWVELDLCGARAANHRPSPEFGGLSSVEAAIQEMEAAGVVVSRP